MVKKTFKFIVTGGEATGGPPIGPAIGPLGIYVMMVVNKINEATAAYKGVKVPVEVTVDTDTKEFTVKLGSLSTYAHITQILGLSKGSPDPKREFVGNLTFDQVVEIAKKKWDDLLASTLKGAVKEILGSCLSMGITVDGKPVKEVLRLIDEGAYDDKLREE
ncbi:50S ribosomal protein L11 [Candidatus Bathyarchaeota archaeon]|nr:MAG: 50S ribosomal protein L11 [Candidatus Bathyarchaeota archaeon]